MPFQNPAKLCLIILWLLCLTITTKADEKTSVKQPQKPLDFQIKLSTATKGYDGKTCWVHARAGAIPVGAPGNQLDNPIVVMTMQKLLLSGSDIFYALNSMRTDNMGKTWHGPLEQKNLSRHNLPDGGEVVVSDFWPQWHAKSKTLLGIGHTVRYYGNRIDHKKNIRVSSYATYDPKKNLWSNWKSLKLPQGPEFFSSGAGSVQRYDLPNGDILLPVYYRRPEKKFSDVMVIRCRFEGETLKYVEHGNELSIDIGRGFAEPSITKFGDWFYMTLRNDKSAYVTRSKDGLHFAPVQQWTFEDGSELGSYNTQAHWVTHSDGLFLVYTRRGAKNDHVFRNRAPLFIGRVNPEKMAIIRSSERIVIPERGARLGNFGVVDVNANETWVIASEWMQTHGPNYVMPVDNKYGSDNSVYVSKILWNLPNALKP
ncbi:MAG: exo-alpha-sialidase [Planctomycetes bacterium]|nr:exo-alpha-sialidase [Planctomycetota bacterium]MCH9724787.1 exo-alpha-sialidase [Planctomycetota bacterium]MCH9778727.1 exo-alpha-sialidase [Planctomycetota bacterium]MCH9789368.1 exo-alpha-sialidase [Planctomycetota bacterium]MDF1743474.1 exo-alpha-sialidase [Gimesia sp.]